LAALPGGESFSLGVVQTAYANGAATRFLREDLGVQTAMAKTGVKHLHHEAVKFDVGIYFESNGHGTVVLSSALLAHAKQQQQREADSGSMVLSSADIGALALLINQAVGDALSGILLVECILRRKNWGVKEWAAIYSDLPSRQLKVTVTFMQPYSNKASPLR
jgi:phosphoacetylglucosamine mutase